MRKHVTVCRFGPPRAGRAAGTFVKPLLIAPHGALDKPWQFCHNGQVFNSDKEDMMALSAHLQELSEKHRLLERRIQEEMARPGSDDLEIRRMKQEKLKLKDEIVRLESDTRH
jgi:hypothetical protein